MISHHQNKCGKKQRTKEANDNRKKSQRDKIPRWVYRDVKPERGFYQRQGWDKRKREGWHSITLKILFRDGLSLLWWDLQLPAGYSEAPSYFNPPRKVMNTVFSWSLICSNTVTCSAPLHFNICKHITREMSQRLYTRLLLSLYHTQEVMCLNAAFVLISSCSIRWWKLMNELNFHMNHAAAQMCSIFTYRRLGNPSPDK